MKYIRTKDGIFKIKTGKKVLVEIDDDYLRSIAVAASDSIDELCDIYAVIDTEANRHTVCGKWTLRELVEFPLDENYEIYGAIWTDWGLKYVALMNENGELELL